MKFRNMAYQNLTFDLQSLSWDWTHYIENLCVLECEIVAAAPNFNWSQIWIYCEFPISCQQHHVWKIWYEIWRHSFSGLPHFSLFFKKLHLFSTDEKFDGTYFQYTWEIWRNIFSAQMRNLTEHIFSADEKFDGTYQTNVVVGSDGHCLFIPPGIFKVIYLTEHIDQEFWP